MSAKQSFSNICILTLISSCFGSNVTVKRGVFDGNFGNGFHDNGLSFGGLPPGAVFFNHGSPVVYGKPVLVSKSPYPPVSPAEIASAISAAKEATGQVLQAQQRVQTAKESVLEQQRIANRKESQAGIAAQKAEAAAAVQRQEAHAAATAVVQAQQRLAQAKAEVADYQRIAAAKESHAAALIQKSASAAADEIQKSEHTAAKLAALQRSDATVYKHASAAKDAQLSAASAAVAASASHYPSTGNGHWYPQEVAIGPWHK